MSTFDNFTVHPYKYLDICTWEETSKPRISFVDSFDYLDGKKTLPSAVEGRPCGFLPKLMGAEDVEEDLRIEPYADYKSDFFSAFVVRASQMTKLEGRCGFFTPYVWMFIQSYEKLRQYLYSQATLETLIQFEYSAFEEATVPVCTFTFAKRHVNKKGNYLRLVDFRGGMEVQRQKTLEAIVNHNCGFYYEQSSDNFAKIPGSPVAYWVSKNRFSAFEKGKSLGDLAEPRGGLSTTDNARFLRYWYEVRERNITFDVNDTLETEKRNETWAPIAKGGDYRKWYGNNEYVVKWYHNGAEIKHHVVNNPNDPNTKSWSRRIFNYTYYFHPCVTWSGISSGNLSVRMADHQIFGGGGKALFSNDNLEFYCALLNSCVALRCLEFISPTLNYESGHIAKIPVLPENTKMKTINDITDSCRKLSKNDWDAFETSWDFKKHPLV